MSLPTMLVAFARYSRDQSFQVLRANTAFVAVMAAGSIAGTVLGGLLFGVIPDELSPPWRIVKPGEPIEMIDASMVTRRSLWKDPRNNGLFAILATIQTDYACTISAIDKKERVEHWHKLTGRAFEQLAIADYPVPSAVGEFLRVWQEGSAVTVSGPHQRRIAGRSSRL